MALGIDEATRIVRFCLAGDGWGTATHEEHGCVLSMVVNSVARAQPFRFVGDTFEEAFKLAVDAGVLKTGSVERQIEFLRRTLQPRSGRSVTEAVPTVRELQFPEATAIVSALVHETQRERGMSSYYVASQGRLFGEELAAQWRATERRERDLRRFRERSASRLPAPVAGQLALVEDLLAGVAVSRGRIEKLMVRPAELIESYSKVNQEVLRVVDGLLVTVVDPSQRPTAFAWMALLYAKEKTGIERAQLVSAFVRDRYFFGQYRSLLGLIAARESYLHLFGAAAPPSASSLMQESLRSESANTVQQMEVIALARRRGGFGVDPSAWFTAISLQMELFSDVELAVRGSFAQPVA